MSWVLTIVGVVILCAGLAAGFLGHLAVMWTGSAGFLAMLVAANLDRISEFKASSKGIEARTRDVVARAETAIAELRLLAVQIAELTLSLLKRSGRMGGYTDDEETAFKDSVLGVLKKIGVSESEFPSIQRDWHKITEFDYSYFILGGPYLPSDARPEMANGWMALKDRGLERPATPDEIRAFAEKNSFLTPELDGYLQDYEFYQQHKTHRRPDVWRERQKWGQLERRE
jgi:hypothetical protein